VAACDDCTRAAVDLPVFDSRFGSVTRRTTEMAIKVEIASATGQRGSARMSRSSIRSGVPGTAPELSASVATRIRYSSRRGLFSGRARLGREPAFRVQATL
jgi:hypothetical protein